MKENCLIAGFSLPERPSGAEIHPFVSGALKGYRRELHNE